VTGKGLDKLIALGEGLTLEFKTSVSGHLGREICAMANTEGGRILIGVDDSGQNVGVSQPNRAKSQVQNAARNLDPALAIEVEPVGNILVVTVPSGPNKPYSSSGQFYLRDASTTQQMRRGEIQEFFFKEGLVRWDEQPCSEFSMERDFDAKKYRSFVRATGIPSGLKRQDVLRNLDVLTDDGMRNAGVLVFAKIVSRFHLQASVTCALFQGASKVKILDKQTYHGGILDTYRDTMSYLLSHLNTEYIIKGGPREEVLELPEEALREAVLNAIAHRDYRSTSNVQVHIFQDRVEITNPGGLVPGLSKKDLGRVSRPRNLRLFSLMDRMELVENVGSGIKRMRDAIQEYGLKPPVIEAGDDWFTITFVRKPQQVSVEDTTQKTTQKTTQRKAGLTTQKTRAHILSLMQENPAITREQLAATIGVTTDGIRYHLRKLKQDNIIRRVGPDKGGFWEVLA